MSSVCLHSKAGTTLLMFRHQHRDLILNSCTFLPKTSQDYWIKTGHIDDLNHKESTSHKPLMLTVVLQLTSQIHFR